MKVDGEAHENRVCRISTVNDIGRGIVGLWRGGGANSGSKRTTAAPTGAMSTGITVHRLPEVASLLEGTDKELASHREWIAVQGHIGASALRLPVTGVVDDSLMNGGAGRRTVVTQPSRAISGSAALTAPRYRFPPIYLIDGNDD
jgi:hypothetical protein